MNSKVYFLSADQIKPIALGRGACLATDYITVEGGKVGFMYREAPRNNVDSGWRFPSGSESQEYLDDPINIAFYDVNTIANYDEDIVPYLGAPTGSAFERQGVAGVVSVEFDPED